MSEEIKKENPLGAEAAEENEAVPAEPVDAAEAADVAAEAVDSAAEAVDSAADAVDASADAVDAAADAVDVAADAVDVAADAVDVAADAVDAAEDAADTDADADDAAAETTGEETVDPALEGELEQLRDTFQEKYDETVEEAAHGPVIQELETHSSEAEEEAEEAEEAVAEAAKPAKKKMKKGVKALLAVVIAVAVLLFGLLITYFVMSVTNPNFNSLVSSLANAYSAEGYDAKKTAFEEALSYCDGDSSTQTAMKDYIVDEILKAAYEEKGFSEAQTLMNGYYTEEQLADSRSKTVRTIKKVIAAVDEIADGSLDAVFAALDENAEADAKAVAAKFSAPDEVSETLLSAFENEINGVKTLRESFGVNSSNTAITYLQTAYSTFTGAGADSRDLGEKMAVALYKKGYVFAAMTISTALGEAENGNLNQDYTDMLADVGDLSDLSVSLFDMAAEAVRDGKTDYAALVAEKAGLSETKAALVGDLVGFCADGIRSENEKNFSLAASAFLNTNTVADTLGISDSKLIFHTVNSLVASGNLGELNSYDALLTDDVVAGLTPEEAARAEQFHQIYKALSASSQVFSEYYSAYAYYGQPIDYAAACEALDALITADSTNYDKGFVAYCKYFAAVYSDHEDEGKQYVAEMKAQMPDLKTVYGYYQIDLDKEAGEYAKAMADAEEILASNVGDDYANATVAFVKRTQGDVEGALEAALNGILLSGSKTFCGNEAAVDYMLTGDFESAFEYLKNMYQSSMSIESCDMILIYNALYKGDNKDIKEDLAALVEEINQMYENYGATSLSDATAIISGEKTLEDVFLSGTYALENDAAQAEETTAEAAE